MAITASGDWWELDNVGLLRIYCQGDMPDYNDETAVPWYSQRGDVLSITIEDSVTSIGDWAFSVCSGLTSVTIPYGVTSIGERAFSDCSSLTSVTIPDSVTSIGDFAFSACFSLTSITIPDSVTSIGDFAFGACESLTSITIPDRVTSISDFTFGSCYALTSIIIPNSVTSIGESAFYDCTKLTDVYYFGTQAQWNQITIGLDNDSLTSATIHYNYSPPAQTPTISTQPVSASYTTGDTAAPLTVSASVTDGGTLSYQWYTTGGAISGATSASYTPDTSAAGTTGYYCTVTNTLGQDTASVDSATATVTVTADNPLADINYTGDSKIIRRICRKLNAVGGGGGGTTYPRMIIDSGGYVAADYGPEDAEQNGNGQTD